LYERLAGWFPDDPGILERWGFCLIATANTTSDPESRKAQRQKGRQVLLRAREKGSNSDLLNVLLENLPEDGSSAPRPKSPAQGALEEGERAFVAGDFDAALKAYARTLELEPKNYLATLFTGDVYFKEKDYVRAAKWFEKATLIDPDVETGWRYWGDALMANNKLDEARPKFIEAVLVKPYTKGTWLALKHWASVAKMDAKHPAIDIPVRMDPDDTSKAAVYVENAITDPAQNAWLAYGLHREVWRREMFARVFPAEKAYRHSLAEEVAALENAVAAALKAQAKGTTLSPGLEQLIVLSRSDVLEPFVLFAKVDKGIAVDYAKYRNEHADVLRKYLNEVYIVKPEAPSR
jgi:tetratricopeptide (TPR) repeat protein